MNKKFKVGDLCRVVNPSVCQAYQSNKESDHIRITENSIGNRYRCDILSSENKLLTEFDYCFTDSDLELITPEPKTLDNLQKGDVVVWSFGEQTVLFVLEPGLYLVSEVNDPKRTSNICNAYDLKSGDAKIKDQEPLEVTLQEVSEKFGREVKIKELQAQESNKYKGE